MTYRDILEKLSQMNDTELNMDAVIYDSEVDEYHPVMYIMFSNEKDCDVLIDGHPVMIKG